MFNPLTDTLPEFAFPVNIDMGDGSTFTGNGMTLRDYFAAKAMQGMSSIPQTLDEKDENLARWAYNMADAMLAERAK